MMSSIGFAKNEAQTMEQVNQLAKWFYIPPREKACLLHGRGKDGAVRVAVGAQLTSDGDCR